MSWDSVPWFVGGGAEHSPEVARLLAFAAVGGAEGIVEAADLKVAPLAVPGASVRVAPGAALIRNRATGGAQQTYVGRNPTEDVVQIAATGGSKRSDLIVAQIEDPYMAGEPWQDPANPAVGPYVFTRVIPNVPAGTKSLQELPAYAGRSAVVLARVDLPASTGTVTAAMITDLRKLARPRSERKLILHAHSGDSRELKSTTWTEWFPVKFEVEIPEWATYCNILGQVYSPVQANGQSFGEVQIRFDGRSGLAGQWDLNIASSAGNGARAHPLVMKWDSPVNVASRGTTKTIEIWGRAIKVVASDTGYMVADGKTQVALDVEFLELPV